MKNSWSRLLVGVILATGAWSSGQVLPDGASGVPFVCPVRTRPAPEPMTDADRADFERRLHYREVFPAYVAMMPPEPEPFLFMPVQGVSVARVANTWGAARDGGRSHEGQDIFAPAGTPVFAAAPGYVYRIGLNNRGGNVVTVIAAGGHRHYYAHLSEYGDIREGQYVDIDTIIGFVGNTGNAATTPPHLHFGVYAGEPGDPCGWNALDPLPLLVDRQP